MAQLEHKITYVCISETWLNPSIEGRFNLGDEYKPFYQSRKFKTGGGSAIYAHENTSNTIKVVNIYEFKTAETVTIQITNPKQPTYMVCQMYRPPENDLEFLQELEEFLSLISASNIHMYITGDCNVDLFSLPSNSNCETFFTLMCSYGFLPTISKATRVSTTSKTLIDNIFTNDLTRIQLSGIILTDISDHLPVFAATHTTSSESKKTEGYRKKTVFDYKNVDNLIQHLVHKLEDLTSQADPELVCEKIIHTYMEGITKLSKTVTFSRKNSFLKPWMTPALLCSINHKNILFANKLKEPSAENISKYNAYRNCLNRTILHAKRMYYSNEFSEHCNNPKRTWETLNKLLKIKNKCDTLPSISHTNSDNELTGTSSLAEKFNKFFTEVGEALKQSIPKNDTDPLENIDTATEEIIEFSEVSNSAVEQIIMQLKNVGAGIDGINTKLVKSTYKPILPKLTYFFNLCLSKGIFPKLLKRAEVKPIFKNGDPECISNYRPISILPVFSKILEK